MCDVIVEEEEEEEEEEVSSTDDVSKLMSRTKEEEEEEEEEGLQNEGRKNNNSKDWGCVLCMRWFTRTMQETSKKEYNTYDEMLRTDCSTGQSKSIIRPPFGQLSYDFMGRKNIISNRKSPAK
ncbi:hypothetical protein L249_0593 [Ophiocordyceps polyrhachis-furcata BCC 54312]|uniref:Uncharacterized protein n=1 Tax=Ophiocordyceps polyrhachis-furcata BCC 54312 TaxID=1330021 RepID=A0A367LCL4_9HYPO|nr:hypothetical protein L249_0593 [Ophiocordyceps polyrhachis-furcata BCC 54312]